jgi:hypothetical protein
MQVLLIVRGGSKTNDKGRELVKEPSTLRKELMKIESIANVVVSDFDTLSKFDQLKEIRAADVSFLLACLLVCLFVYFYLFFFCGSANSALWTTPFISQHVVLFKLIPNSHSHSLVCPLSNEHRRLSGSFRSDRPFFSFLKYNPPIVGRGSKHHYLPCPPITDHRSLAMSSPARFLWQRTVQH